MFCGLYSTGSQADRLRQNLRRSQYIWLFQAPLLPELQMAANDYKSLEDVFQGDTFGVKTPGALKAWLLTGSRFSVARHAWPAAHGTSTRNDA